MSMTVEARAISNLLTLAKLVSNGNNDGNIYVGLMPTADGRNRIVKFDAGGEPTTEMKNCCENLRKEISKWATCLKKTKWGVLGSLEKNDVNELRAKKLCETIRVKVVGMAGDFSAEQFEDSTFARGKPLAFKTIKEALATDVKLSYIPQKTSERGKAIAKVVAQRSAFSNILHAIGRGIMRATHAIKAFFTGQAKAAAGWNETVNDYEQLAKNADKVEKKWNLPPLLGKGSVKLDAHVVASSCGLSGKLNVRPFGKDEKLYPSGNPSLSDIEQNPDLQDCWFLSSLAAMLRTQGPSYIRGLIDTEHAPDGHALVRLGQHQYEVPLGDVLADGKRVVSNSKPWVRLLEQAMAMHLSQKDEDNNAEIKGQNLKMAFRGAQDALDALAGVEINWTVGSMGPTKTSGVASPVIVPLSIDSLNEMSGGGKIPLVLGSKAGVKGTLASLGTGISPGHACTVLKIDSQKKRVTVLDPYGHIRHVPESALKHFDLVCISGDSWRKNQEKKGAGFTPIITLPKAKPNDKVVLEINDGSVPKSGGSFGGFDIVE